MFCSQGGYQVKLTITDSSYNGYINGNADSNALVSGEAKRLNLKYSKETDYFALIFKRELYLLNIPRHFAW